MANVHLVLSNPLCFLINKFGREQVKLLNCALIDFYEADDLIVAKQQLLKDIDNANTGVSYPHIPQQRQGENRAQRTVDDMFTLLTILDENKFLDILPTYVANSPDHMPSFRLYDGDLNVLRMMLEKLQHKIEEYGPALSAITSEVSTLQAKFTALERSKSMSAECFPPLQPTSLQTRQVQPHPQIQSRQQQHRDQSSSSNFNHTRDDHNTTVAKSSVQWGATATASTPTSNRFATLASTTDEEDGLNPFEDVQSKKKRRRNKTPPHQQQLQQPDVPRVDKLTQQRQQQPSRRRQTVLGKSATVMNITAAKKVSRRKAVFLC